MTNDSAIKKKRLLTLLVAIGSIVADQTSKNYARSSLLPGATEKLIPGFLNLQLTTNTGAAFSLGSGTIVPTLAATTITLLVVGYAGKRTKEQLSTAEGCGLGFLIGGALGNLIDRFTLGRVTDFLDFAFISFPVFNVADVLIDVGIGLILIASLRNSKNKGVGSLSHSPESTDVSSAPRG